MTTSHSTADEQLRPRTSGSSAWNLYFLGKIALAYFGYLVLSPELNALLFGVVLIPIQSKIVRRLRDAAALIAGFALLWHESWLPGPEVIAANASNLAAFTPAYLLELAESFVNTQMIAWGLAGFTLWLLLKNWVRFTTLSALGLLFTAFPGLLAFVVQPFTSPSVQESSAESSIRTAVNEVPAGQSQTAAAEKTKQLQPPQTEAASDNAINTWLEAFYQSESQRHASLPSGLIPIEQSGAFDIALVNICSLAQDDLEATGLADHELFKRFDIRLTNYNAATSYSGPATLRLLNSLCGQSSHQALYNGRRTSCELMTQLESAGWTPQLFFDHNGKFEDYLDSLRKYAGLKPPLAPHTGLKPIYEGFDGSPIFSALDVLHSWKNSLPPEPTRTITLFNLIALHDGNRTPGAGKSLDFKPRAERLLRDLNTFMNELEASGRPVLLLIVPEHGAAVRGDRIQMARLREIPSPHITHVPVFAKFFGLSTKTPEIVIDTPTSHLAVGELIARTITSGAYTHAKPLDLTALTSNLPQTWSVSENSNASVAQYKDNFWVKLQQSKWMPYKQ